jgi:hypothetical protein
LRQPIGGPIVYVRRPVGGIRYGVDVFVDVTRFIVGQSKGGYMASDSIRFACPSCGKIVKAKPHYAGHTVACPICHAAMVVPGDAPVVGPPPEVL